MKLVKTLIVSSLIIACTGLLYSQEKARSPLFSPSLPENYELGIIFSAPSILMDIERYEGGFGIKKSYKYWAVRWAADLIYASGSRLSSLSIMRAQEQHLSEIGFEKLDISPYYGWFASVGYIRQRFLVDEENHINDMTFPITGGPIIGAELFLFEFLSIFAEYQLALEFDILLNRVTIAGTSVNNWGLDVLIDTKMGNSSRLGVVLYLP